MKTGSELSAQALREAFDASFAQPLASAREERERYLGLRIGPRGYVVPIAEIGGLEAARRVVPLPGGALPLLGLSGIRGHLYPVYSVAHLLAQETPDERPRWLLLPSGNDLAAFSFSQLEGLIELPRGARVDTPVNGAHLVGAVRVEEELRSVLSISSLLRTLTERIPT